MIQSILNYFGYIKKIDSDTKLRGVEEMFEKRIEVLTTSHELTKDELRRAKLELATLHSQDKKSFPLLDINMGDPTPTSPSDRKAYVAQVAGFYKDILEKKIKHMISVTHSLLEEMGSDRDYDLTLKGVVYSFREFLRWGEAMVNEQMSYQTENESDKPKKTLTEKINEL